MSMSKLPMILLCVHNSQSVICGTFTLKTFKTEEKKASRGSQKALDGDHTIVDLLNRRGRDNATVAVAIRRCHSLSGKTHERKFICIQFTPTTRDQFSLAGKSVDLSGELKADRSLTSSISLNVKQAIKRSGEQQWIALIWHGPSNPEPHTLSHTQITFFLPTITSLPLPVSLSRDQYEWRAALSC